MKQTEIRDVDGTIYTCVWSEDERSAEVSAHGFPVCIIYLSKRKGVSVWHNTGLIESYRSAELAALGYIADRRRGKRPETTPVVVTAPPVKKVDWRTLVDAPAKQPEKRENKWHHRKDFDD